MHADRHPPAGARHGGVPGRVLRALLALWLLALGLALGLLVMLAAGVVWAVSRLFGRRAPLPRPVFVARGWRQGPHPHPHPRDGGEVVDVEVREIRSP